MTKATSQLTNENLIVLWTNGKRGFGSNGCPGRGTRSNRRLNSLVDKWENEALFQMAEQEKAEERCQSEELNSFMDNWEKEEKDGLIKKADQDVEGGQINLPLQPTQEQKVRKISV